MRHPVHDEELSMEEALAAIRRAITHEEAGETASPAEPWNCETARQRNTACRIVPCFHMNVV
jgi:hypothetical protein